MPIEKLESVLEDTELADRKEQEKLHDKAAKERGKVPSDIYAKVVRFTNEARRQYGDLVKSVLIFGSAVRGDMKTGSDADIWVILDNTATKGTEDLNKINTQLYLIAHELKDLHVQTTTLTEFWEWMKLGSPELVNFLRYGLAIYDTGFIKPVQRMLEMGLIPPSEETIKLKARAAEVRLRKLKLDLKSMIFELRYCASDAIQAAVMHHYKAQPDLKAIPNFLEKFVREKKLERKYIEKFDKLNKLWKKIDHKEIKEVTTAHVNEALQLTNEIIERFKKLIPKNVLGEEIKEPTKPKAKLKRKQTRSKK